MSTAPLLAPPDARMLFDRMPNRKIMVIGDVMIDEWIWGTVTRISPEAPVPVVNVDDHSFTLGGAANVANNLRPLGASVQLVGAVGADDLAKRLGSLLDDIAVTREGLLVVNDRPTTRKTRIVAHSQQVVRADWESTAAISRADSARIADVVRSHASQADAVVISDYGKGLLSREVVEAALAAPLVVVDPKPQNMELFAGVSCVAPNMHEAEIATGLRITDDASLERVARTLLERLGCRYVIITRGERGMALFSSDGLQLHVPAVARTVYDVSGAGDTAVAVLTLAFAAGASAELALQLANFAAGAVVEKLGTATASPDEILALIDHGFQAG
ncbi:MAG: D-glycero-beta-D-manno-heptose-7-phosphate kinase [Candidatus Eremiobacteraeota bacterium]|nr:D-glycero-beta-D-manno-heptose-7-phosphate kinase [Candidatus Eremiobacteraeota bacterium]